MALPKASDLTLREKTGLMAGPVPTPFEAVRLALNYNSSAFPAAGIPARGIPGIHFTDGPRGVVMGHSTCFPAAIARGASWDPDLEEAIGDAIGREARSLGANLFAGICINVIRHPAWGRSQESYGEDPFHLGEMGSALVRGSGRHVLTCIKHFACNSMENARFRVNVEISEEALQEIYLPHFRRCIETGAESVMSAYNRLNGDYCGENHHLLTDILKRQWGFEGFVMTDFLMGIRNGTKGVNAGQDLEMPFRWRLLGLGRAVRQGKVPVSRIDDAATRLLWAQGRLETKSPSVPVSVDANRELARRSAEASMVLLKNERALLPLDRSTVRNVALIGPLASIPNTGDLGSSRVRPVHVVTPEEGITGYLKGGARVSVCNSRSPSRVAAAAAAADAAVVVAGYTHRDEGEYILLIGGDRKRLSLSADDEAMILAAVKANPKTVVVLMGGSSIVAENWRHEVPAILCAWYPGQEGGHALARVLFGDAEPGGRLPLAVPKSPRQLPYFDRNADKIQYDHFHGYRLMDKRGDEPAYPFGFGLGYADIRSTAVRPLATEVARDGQIEFEIRLENRSQRAGSAVIQIYAGRSQNTGRPVRELKAFQKVHLGSGETREIRLGFPVSRLARFNTSLSTWSVAPGPAQVWVGSSSRTEDLKAFEITVE